MSKDIANQLFLAYNGRPADASWRSATANLLNGAAPSVELQKAFYNAAVLDGRFAPTDSAPGLIDKIFQNIFGFSATPYEQAAWAKMIDAGAISIETAAWTIFASYLGATNIPDSYLTPAQSKLITVDAITNQLENDPVANKAMSELGSAAAAAARNYVKTISSPSDAGKTLADVQNVVADYSSKTPTTPTTTKTPTTPTTSTTPTSNDSALSAEPGFTTGIDALTGTSGDDKFTATTATLQARDSLDALSGNDTLAISYDGKTKLTLPATLKGLEAITFTGDKQGADFSAADSVTSVTLNGVANSASYTLGTKQALTISDTTGLDKTKAISIAEPTKDPAANMTVILGGSKDGLSGGAGLDFTGAALTTLTIKTEVKNDFKLVNTAGAINSVSFDASKAKGANNLDASALATATFDVKTGAGDDTITLRADKLADALSIDGGAGSDTLKLTGLPKIQDSDLQRVTNVENITFVSTSEGGGAFIRVALKDSQIPSGAAMTFDSSSMGSTGMTINAKDETDGVFVLKGGGGDDYIVWMAGKFTDKSSFDGGAGTDAISLEGDSAISASDLDNVTNVERITVLNQESNVTVKTKDSLVAVGAKLAFQATSLTTGKLDFDGSAEADGNFDVKSGGGDDSFLFTAGKFTKASALDAGEGEDTLTLTGEAEIGATDLEQVSNIETIKIANATTNVAVKTKDALVASGATLKFDASSLTTGSLTFNGSDEANGAFRITAGTGADAITGGKGDDAFTFASGSLTSADSVNGGGGADTLILTGNEAIGGSDFDNVTNVETISIANTTSNVTVVTKNSLVASEAKTLFDASSLTTGTLNFDGSAETDGSLSVKSGGGDDSFVFSAGKLKSDSAIDGGAGSDKLSLVGDASTSVVSPNDLDNVTNVETISISNKTANVYVTAKDSLVAEGAALTFDASSLTTGKLTFDGGAETDGRLQIIGGAANDKITGGKSADKGQGDVIDLGTGTDVYVLGEKGVGATGVVTPSAGGVTPSSAIGNLTFSTKAMDKVSGINSARDSIRIMKLDCGGTLLHDGVWGAATAGDLALLTGVYDSAAETFKTDPNGSDSALIFDDNGTNDGGSYRAVILVGYVDREQNDTAGRSGEFENNNAVSFAAFTVVGAGFTAKIDDVKGTEVDDSLTATTATLQAEDSLDALEGKDTLAITYDGKTKLTLPGTIKGLEAITFTGDAQGADFSAVQTATSITLDAIAKSANYKLGAGQNLTISNTTPDSAQKTVSIEVVAAEPASLNVTLSGTNAVLGGGSVLDFAGGLKTLKIENDAPNDFKLTNSGGAITAVTFVGNRAKGANNIDASALTNATLDITGGAGNDTITLRSSQLAKVSGLNGLNGDNVLKLLGNDPIGATDFEHVKNFTTIQVENTTTDVKVILPESSTLTDSLTFDASSLETGNLTFQGSPRSVTNYIVKTGAGIDNLKGGDSQDTFVFVSGKLTSDDAVDGGGGSLDTLKLTGNNEIHATDFDQVKKVERIEFANTTSDVTITAKDEMVDGGWGATGQLALNASSLSTGKLTFDGSAETDANFTISSGGGDDVIKLNILANVNPPHINSVAIDSGGGDDTITLGISNLTKDSTINLGDGSDTLKLTGDKLIASTDFDNVTNVESIQLDDVTWRANVTTKDALVAKGATLTFAANKISGQLNFDGSAESDGNFKITAGAGGDVIKGSSSADSGYGDIINLGTGWDTYILPNKGIGSTGVVKPTAGSVTPSSNIGNLAFSTTAMDKISGMNNAGDYIKIESLYTSKPLLRGGAWGSEWDGNAALLKGTYNSTAETFTTNASGTDSALIFDDSGTMREGNYRALILVGYVDATNNDAWVSRGEYMEFAVV